MISQQIATDKAKTVATANNCVWRDDDIHVELADARAPSENRIKRALLESAEGFPACWLVRVGKAPTTGDWIDEDMNAPRGEGYGYLINVETGAFMGIDVGYEIVLKKYTGLKD